jgi:SAM-dependent methyltransferase
MQSADRAEGRRNRQREPGLPDSQRYREGFATHDDITPELRCEGVRVVPHSIDLPAFWKFVDAGQYRHRTYYDGGRQACAVNKWLEHYVSLELLEPRPGEVLIDVANCYSPFPDVVRDLTGLTVFRQDLIYDVGIHGDRIGGNAADLPLKDEFADLLTLHCSFEHFEGTSDQEFIREAERIMKPGGRLCILPLYTHREYAIQSDPSTWDNRTVQFEPDAIIYLARGWGERHGRLYDAHHFLDRIVANLGHLRLTIYTMENYAEAWDHCYLRFAAVFRKPVG